MTDSLITWALILTNACLVGVGGLLAATSYQAYRQSESTQSYLTAAAGFGLLVVGGLLDILVGYLLVHSLTVDQYIVIEAVGTLHIVVGLGCLFVAILNHDTNPGPVERYSFSRRDSGSDPWQNR